MGAGVLVETDYYSTMLFSMGLGIFIASALQLVRTLYWRSPQHRPEYEAKKQQAHIDCVDERKQFLRMKAAQVTGTVMTLLLLLLGFSLALVRAEPWVIAMIFLLFVFQFLCGAVVLRILEKRM